MKALKVGDRVAVYNRYLFAMPVKGVVIGFAPKGAVQVRLDADSHANAAARRVDQYYFRQECRLLTRPTRREFWIENGKSGAPLDYRSSFLETRRLLQPGERVVFREVRKKI